jgi:hypothetical protein
MAGELDQAGQGFRRDHSVRFGVLQCRQRHHEVAEVIRRTND